MGVNPFTYNNSVGTGFSSTPLNLQQQDYSSSTGWGTGVSLLQSSSPYPGSSASSSMIFNTSNGNAGYNNSTSVDMSSFMGLLTQIVAVVIALLLKPSINTASSSQPTSDSNAPASSTGSETTSTPPPATPAPAPPTASPPPPTPVPTPPPAAPAPAPPAAPPAASPPPATKDTVKTDSVNGGGPNEMVLKNTDCKPMTIALFENTGPGMNPDIDDPNHKYTLQPGETLKLSMPASWQGRAQKLSGNAGDPASWAEINYEPGQNGGQSKIWYDLSLIRGYNSAVTMRPTNSSNTADVAGTDKSIIDGAPADATTTDAGGNKVIKDTEGFDGSVQQAAVDYFNSAVGNTIAYVRHDDDKAVRTTQDNSLTVTFGAA